MNVVLGRVVLPTVFCAKSIVIFVHFIALLANPELPPLLSTIVWHWTE